MSTNKNETTKSNVKAKSAVKQKAELAKEMAELQAQIDLINKKKAELAEKENAVAEAAREELEAILHTLPGLTGLPDLATVGRCAMSLAKNGHLKGEKSTSTGPRKERVTLSDEDKAKVIEELKAMQAAKAGIIGHCRAIESRPGMPGFQTLYSWAGEAGLTTKRAETTATK